MQQFKKIALASAVSAVMMASGVAEAHVSYHLPDALGANTTDAPNSNGSVDAGTWTGGSPTVAGKDYAAALPVTWIANVHHNDHNYAVSTADAISKGAASDYTLSSFNNKWNESPLTFGPGSSWGAALDYGLINTDVAGDLTITISADSTLASDFAAGFTLWSGWGDAGTGNKHQAWNFDANNPDSLSVTGTTYLGHASTTVSGGTATLTYSNIAAGQYSLFIGGNGSDNTNQFYTADISVSAVPVPAAAWLMGSAILGLAGMRRKTATVA